ncbi:VanZ family protein [Nocardioides koreensis]
MEVITRILLGQRQVLMTLGFSSLVLVPLVAVAARRAGCSWWRTASAGLAGLGTALVLAVTLGRYQDGMLLRWGRGCLLQPGLSLTSPEARLNFLLFAPACFFAVLACRRLLPVLALTLLASLLVEAVQSVTGAGTCQTSDIVRNVAGGGLAGLAALVLVALSRASRPVGES